MIKKKSMTAAFTLIELLVVITIIGILAGIALPVFNTVQVKGSQTKGLAQAKQIGLALKIFAGDNDGAYPANGTPGGTSGFTADPNTANDAFACLFPQYLTNEAIFGNKLVAKAATPDNVYDKAWKPNARVDTLKKGENVYGYMAGLTDASNAACPLVFDGPAADKKTYTNAVGAQGAVWNGTKAICIRLDNSGTLETLDVTSPTASFIKAVDTTGKTVNALDPAANDQNLGASNKVLMPDL